MKLEIKYKKKWEKTHKYMETKQHDTEQQMSQWSNQRKKFKKYIAQWKWKHNSPKSLGHSKSSSKRKVCSDAGLPQEKRKGSNKQFSLIHKGTRKRRMKPKVNRRKEIIKIRAEKKMT